MLKSLTKQVQNLNSENHKKLLKEMKEYLTKCKKIRWSWWISAFVKSGTWERTFLIFWESCQKPTSSHSTCGKPDAFPLTPGHLRRNQTDVEADTETERNWIRPWYCWDVQPNQSGRPTYLWNFYYQVTTVPFIIQASLSSFSLLIIKHTLTD